MGRLYPVTYKYFCKLCSSPPGLKENDLWLHALVRTAALFAVVIVDDVAAVVVADDVDASVVGFLVVVNGTVVL